MISQKAPHVLVETDHPPAAPRLMGRQPGGILRRRWVNNNINFGAQRTPLPLLFHSLQTVSG